MPQKFTELAFAIDLKSDQDLIKKYKDMHAVADPLLASGMRQIGVQSQKIFNTGNRLFMTLTVPERFNYVEAFERYSQNTPGAVAWDSMMRRLQQPIAWKRDEEWWTEMSLVYDMDWFRSGK
jgi:L-rhamnose mutarotase